MLPAALKSTYNQFKQAFDRFGHHKLTDWAAALTYYSVLSIFPALLVIVSLLSVIGHGTQQAVLETLGELPDGPTQEILIGAINHISDAGGAATTALVIGGLVAIYSASSYVGAFIRAATVILNVEETRRFYVTIPLRYGLTIVLLVLVVITAVAIALTGPIADEVSRLTGISQQDIAWTALRWPLVLLLFYIGLGLLYALGPDHERRRWRFGTPGAALAMVIWLVASLLFSLYVSNFANYNRVFGSLAGIAVFLIWLYISNLSVLLGLEFDHELRRFRRVHGYGAFSRRRFASGVDHASASSDDEASGN